MSAFLKQQSNKLEARSHTIETKPKPDSGYVRFLEERIEQGKAKEGEMEKLRFKMIDLETKMEKLLNKETKAEGDTSNLLKMVEKLDKRAKAVEERSKVFDEMEKQIMSRYVGNSGVIRPGDQTELQDAAGGAIRRKTEERVEGEHCQGSD